MTTEATGRIRDFVLALHECWPSGDPVRLATFYDEDVVLLPPDLGVPIQGREAVVASYDDFLQAATLENFTVEDLALFPFSGEGAPSGKGAPDLWMAHLTFSITYVLGGERYVERGMEVYAITDRDGRPAIVWRSQAVLDSRLEAKSEAAD
jgi:hypothetical protein